MRLDDVESRAFTKKTLDIWCGRADGEELQLYEVHQLASVSDLFQITELTEVVSALEQAAMGHQSLEACGEVLTCRRVRDAAAGGRSAEDGGGAVRGVCERTAGFMRMGWEALGSVLDDNWLVARNEEAVWESVVEWKRDAAGELGWRGVVRKVLFR